MNQYLKIKGNKSSGGGDQDVVLQLGDRTHGKFRLKFKIWVFYGDRGYYNLLHKFTPNSSHNEWACNVYFDGYGSGRLIVKNVSYYFTYKTGEWVDIEHVIDLNNDLSDFYVAGHHVRRWTFSHQATRHAPGTKKLSAIDFYPVNNTYEFYIDDIDFKKVNNLSEEDATASSRSKNSTAFGQVSEQPSLSVSPNPFHSSIDISIPSGITDGELAIFDQFGRLVKQLPAIKEAADTAINVDVADLAVGVYYVRLAYGEEVITEKIVKQ